MESHKNDFSNYINQADEQAIKAQYWVQQYLLSETSKVKMESRISAYKNSQAPLEYVQREQLIKHLCKETHYKNLLINIENICNDMGEECYCITEAYPVYKNKFKELFVATWRLYFTPEGQSL